MAQESPQLYTVDQYLAIERKATSRHFFLDGEIYALAGESGPHGDISANLVITLGSQLKGTSCRVRTKDTKVRSGAMLSAGETTRGLFSYPDVVIVCGDPIYHDNCQDVVLNPNVILEALSESTEAFDRGEKYIRFQTWKSSLTDYLLVPQERRGGRGFGYSRNPGERAGVRGKVIDLEQGWRLANAIG